MRLLFTVLILTAAAWADQLQVGHAQVVITPGPGTPMAGYYSTRLATGTHDDLHAKAIVLAKDGRKSAMVALDLVAVPPHVVEQAREEASRATGIPVENIIISATHAHTGPILTGRGARDAMYGGDLPAGAGLVLHDGRHVELLRKLMRIYAGQVVGTRAGRKTDQDPHHASVLRCSGRQQGGSNHCRRHKTREHLSDRHVEVSCRLRAQSG